MRHAFPSSVVCLSMRPLLTHTPSIFTKPLKELPQIPNYPVPSYPTPSWPSPGWPMRPVFNRPATGGSNDFTFALYFPSLRELLGETSDGSLLMIRWTVTKKANPGPATGSSRTGKTWQSLTHFSTLSNGWIPDDGVDFFKQFLDHLRAKWLQICQEAEELLSYWVRMQWLVP